MIAMHYMAEALNSYAWGNNPYWLEWICLAGNYTGCWT